MLAAASYVLFRRRRFFLGWVAADGHPAQRCPGALNFPGPDADGGSRSPGVAWSVKRGSVGQTARPRCRHKPLLASVLAANNLG